MLGSKSAIDTHFEANKRKQEIVWAVGDSGINVGELTAEDMKASMMNKQDRRLEVLTVADVEEAEEMLRMLMGNDVESRREFLFENVDFSKLNSLS